MFFILAVNIFGSNAEVMKIIKFVHIKVLKNNAPSFKLCLNMSSWVYNA